MTYAPTLLPYKHEPPSQVSPEPLIDASQKGEGIQPPGNDCEIVKVVRIPILRPESEAMFNSPGSMSGILGLRP